MPYVQANQPFNADVTCARNVLSVIIWYDVHMDLNIIYSVIFSTTTNQKTISLISWYIEL